jgi:hypothetical protein
MVFCILRFIVGKVQVLLWLNKPAVAYCLRRREQKTLDFVTNTVGDMEILQYCKIVSAKKVHISSCIVGHHCLAVPGCL